MTDFSWVATEEERAELRNLNNAVLENADELDAWEKLVKAAEAQEGGLNRNSNPGAISFMREVYDRLLSKFPLFFAYWKKYAEFEFSIAGTEVAEGVYERGIGSIPVSVDLWTSYCAFKVETCHDPDVIRELFERGASGCGLDFLSGIFWNKYLEFEERVDAHDKHFAILLRLIHLPIMGYDRYYDMLTRAAQHRPISELADPDIVEEFRSAMAADMGEKPRSELELERELRSRIDAYYISVFHSTQTEVTKRWQFEEPIQRPYFHVTELSENDLVNWRRYLDFEETEGKHERIVFLYERCLVACALYEEFWLRYARWMRAQPGKDEEVCNIYRRGSCFYVPISRPAVRLQYALFEESQGRVDVARDIHRSMLEVIPSHIETIVSWANLERRHGGVDDAIKIYADHIKSPRCDIYAKGALVAEWARLVWKIGGNADQARKVYESNKMHYLEVRWFWINYFTFELEQSTSAETEKKQNARIKAVFDEICDSSKISPQVIQDIAHHYMAYLLERGDAESAREYLRIDCLQNGPLSVKDKHKIKASEDGTASSTDRRLRRANGHPGVEVDDAAIARGENPYTKYYQEQVGFT